MAEKREEIKPLLEVGFEYTCEKMTRVLQETKITLTEKHPKLYVFLKNYMLSFKSRKQRLSPISTSPMPLTPAAVECPPPIP